MICKRVHRLRLLRARHREQPVQHLRARRADRPPRSRWSAGTTGPRPLRRGTDATSSTRELCAGADTPPRARRRARRRGRRPRRGARRRALRRVGTQLQTRGRVRGRRCRTLSVFSLLGRALLGLDLLELLGERRGHACRRRRRTRGRSCRAGRRGSARCRSTSPAVSAPASRTTTTAVLGHERRAARRVQHRGDDVLPRRLHHRPRRVVAARRRRGRGR